MRTLLVGGLLLASVSAQGGIGIFTRSDDIGSPALKGVAGFDAKSHDYTVSGSGADIWGKADQFHFIWRQMSGNFAVTATTTFLTEGIAHRKASIMLRKTLDADAPFVHLAMHGDGMPSVQFRSVKGDTVNTLDFPIGSPGAWTLKLIRQGSTISVALGKPGASLVELGNTQSALGDPLLVGLAVASHSVDAINTVRFSDVRVELLPPSAAPR